MSKARKRAARSRKAAVRRVATSRMFAPGEHIRTVPLHHPKPVVSIDELARRRREGEEEGDLFDGKAHVAPASAQLTYRNGPLITDVAVFTVFWGAQWGTTPTSTTLMSDLTKFFQAILVSPAIDQLGEYSVAGQSIGHGSFIGTKVISAQAPVGSVTDTEIRTRLDAWIEAETVPKNTKNTLYFIYLDPGIVSIMGGSRSCQNYCGYHDNTGSIYYGVMPYPTCEGCLGGMSAFDALTGTSAHELSEAITDPVPGSGWYDDTNGEIGDICAWNFKKVGGYTVQLEWSNGQGRCV